MRCRIGDAQLPPEHALGRGAAASSRCCGRDCGSRPLCFLCGACSTAQEAEKNHSGWRLKGAWDLNKLKFMLWGTRKWRHRQSRFTVEGGAVPAELGTRDRSGRVQQAALAMGLLRAANTGSTSPSTPKGRPPDAGPGGAAVGPPSWLVAPVPPLFPWNQMAFDLCTGPVRCAWFLRSLMVSR